MFFKNKQVLKDIEDTLDLKVKVSFFKQPNLTLNIFRNPTFWAKKTWRKSRSSSKNSFLTTEFLANSLSRVRWSPVRTSHPNSCTTTISTTWTRLTSGPISTKTNKAWTERANRQPQLQHQLRHLTINIRFQTLFLSNKSFKVVNILTPSLQALPLWKICSSSLPLGK